MERVDVDPSTTLDFVLRGAELADTAAMSQGSLVCHLGLGRYSLCI